MILKKMNILIVNDLTPISEVIRPVLIEDGHEILETYSFKNTIKILEDHEIDLIFLNIRLGQESGIEFLSYLKDNDFDIPTICISKEASNIEALETYKLGVFDFLGEPITPGKLRAALYQTSRFSKLLRQNNELVGEGQGIEFIGNTPYVQSLKQTIEQISHTNSKVLILGETGTGKEVVASMIHYQSMRKKEPFVTINCGAIPSSIIESVLFGHKKGTFTGAHQDQKGKLEFADGGTIFLDELAELSIDAQNKLLRFLENGEVQKIGSNATKKVDVRVLAATSRDLDLYVKQKRFRLDLLYRLNVITIRTLPLRKLTEDIPVLFSYFLESSCKDLKRKVPVVDPDFINDLKKYSWPGNSRELRNAAERCAIFGKDVIKKEDLNLITGEYAATTSDADNKDNLSISFNHQNPMSLKDHRDLCEKNYIAQVLKYFKGNISKTARALSIDRTYLHQKMNNLNIERMKCLGE